MELTTGLRGEGAALTKPGELISRPRMDAQLSWTSYARDGESIYTGTYLHLDRCVL